MTRIAGITSGYKARMIRKMIMSNPSRGPTAPTLKHLARWMIQAEK